MVGGEITSFPFRVPKKHGPGSKYLNRVEPKRFPFPSRPRLLCLLLSLVQFPIVLLSIISCIDSLAFLD